MKKYGLQLRVPPPQKKQTTSHSLLAVPKAFLGEEDSDVEEEIQRQANKNKTLKDIEDQHKKALEEDPSIFDYDGVYDKIKEKTVRPRALELQERKPKYIQGLIEKAKEREKEHDIIYERKLAKERSKEDHIYADKDKFLTTAYKRKLAEQQKWMEEENLRQIREEREDVTKKADISEFYFSLSKNVAFGATTDRDFESKKAKKQVPAAPPIEEEEEEADISATEMKNERVEKEGRRFSQPSSMNSATAGGEKEPEAMAAEPPQGEHMTTREHHKRSGGQVEAAKARFLDRKRIKAVAET